MTRRFFSILGLSLILGLATPAFADNATVTTGGRFMMKTHNDQIVTDQDFAGKFMLIYFGYTYCPDICPTSLQTLTHALDLIKDDAKNFQPLFVSVDPDRDTIPVLREYVAVFHPSLIGLTGSKAVIDNMAKKFRVKYEKVSENGAINDDYTVDHTASIFLMGPDGKYILRFPYNTTAKQMAAKLEEVLKKATSKVQK